MPQMNTEPNDIESIRPAVAGNRLLAIFIL
jgi:hypothetical protein